MFIQRKNTKRRHMTRKIKELFHRLKPYKLKHDQRRQTSVKNSHTKKVNQLRSTNSLRTSPRKKGPATNNINNFLLHWRQQQQQRRLLLGFLNIEAGLYEDGFGGINQWSDDDGSLVVLRLCLLTFNDFLANISVSALIFTVVAAFCSLFLLGHNFHFVVQYWTVGAILRKKIYST